MPVSDFECQIARGQIGRYLDGGALSAQAMSGLEEHLAECSACKALVAERRTALLGSLGGEALSQAVVSMPIENPLIAALRAKSEAPIEKTRAEKPAGKTPKAKAAPRYATETTAKKPLGKPLVLAALLAVVLVGMSRVSHFIGAPTARASTSFAADALPDSPIKPVENPKATVEPTKPVDTPAVKPPITAVKETPVAPVAPSAEEKVEAPKPVVPKPIVPAPVVPKPIVKESTVAAKPVALKPAPKPVPTVKPAPRPVVARKPIVKKAVRGVKRKPAAKRTLKRRPAKARVRKAARVSRTSIRVYGLDGHPLNP